MRRREALLLLVFSPAALAQPQGKVARIGILSARSRSTRTNPDVFFDAFTRGMLELGYIEGKNLAIEWRFADGRTERFDPLAAELVRANVEVIVTHSTAAARALRRATTRLPLVVIGMGDPVGSGLAASLARPGGNVTGVSIIATELAPKYVELLKSVVPKVSRVAYLMTSGNPIHPTLLKRIDAVARQLGIEVLPVGVGTPDGIAAGFGAIVDKRAEAVIVPPDPMLSLKRRQIASLSVANRLPSIFTNRESVEAGGLMSYGPNPLASYRSGAVYVDKILKGAKPAELPIEQPTKFYMTVNLKTAKILGIAIPKELLLRADEVIE
jgi:ABC-type uncharacterized transport system substrate-binding protein